MISAFPDDFDTSQEQMIKRRHFFQTVQNNPLFCLIIGTIGGFLIGRINQYLVTRQNMWCLSSIETDVMRTRDEVPHNGNILTQIRATTDENLVLIGVMTAKKYLQTRVIAARDTWVNHSTSRVIFFTSEGSEVYAPDNVEVVGLRGVDDSYPPQKKSFLMLKYMYDRYKNRYRFFMRADDDVYIKVDRLSSFLHSIDTSNNRALFIGQAGLGNKNEFGLLDLKPNENFCMGGPTMVLSRETLIQVATHVGDCLGNLYTTHEDVEVGRCISRYAGISCTWSYEMQKLFYNNYNEPHGSFTHSLKEPSILHAITLHPFKNSSYMYRIHHYFLSRKASNVRNKVMEMSRRINRINGILQDRDDYYSPNKYGLEPSLMKFVPRSGDEVISWDFIFKHVYSDSHSNPRRIFETDLQVAVDDIILQLMEGTNGNAQHKGRLIDFKELLYGYRRVVTSYSADYVLDLLLTYKKFKGKQKMTIPVRRHVYVQQSFLHPEAMFDNRLESQSSNPELNRVVEEDISKIKSNTFIGNNLKSDLLAKRVNFILPLAGRHETLVKFMTNFEEAYLKTGENVSLHVVLFKGAEENIHHIDTTLFIENMSLKYPESLLTHQILEGPFSRGIALQKGASYFNANDLLFFIDVDIAMKREVLLKVRLNTIAGHQVYYPIVFSQYDPKYVCTNQNTQMSNDKSHFQVKMEEVVQTNSQNVITQHDTYSSATKIHSDISNTIYINNKMSSTPSNYNYYNEINFTQSIHDSMIQQQRHKRIAPSYEDDLEVSRSDKKLKDLFSSIVQDCEPGVEGDDFDLRPQAGYWREFGFGIAAMFKGDFDSIGGFNLEIKGWGKEDVDLVERFITGGFSVFRSVDPCLVHIYHSISCSSRLEPAQYQMCLGSKASSYASIDTLAKIVLGIPDVLNRNENRGTNTDVNGG